MFLFFWFFSVQYASHLCGYLKEWRKNPQWSFSCFLALLLPLLDLPGNISGLAETNVINTQLDTGEMEMTTVVGAVKDSGAIDLTLDDGEEDDDHTAGGEEHDCNDAQLPTEETEKPTTVGDEKETVAINVTTDDEQGYHNPTKEQEVNRNDAQLQTGEMDQPTIVVAVKQSRAINVTLENENDDTKPAKEREDNCNDAQLQTGEMDKRATVGDVSVKDDADKVQEDIGHNPKYSNSKGSQGTQTELSINFSIADRVVEEFACL